MDLYLNSQDEQSLLVFQALSHVDRLKIIELLNTKSVPLQNLKEELHISASSLSKHLKVLEEANLITLKYGENSERKQRFATLKTDFVTIHFPQKLFPELTKISETVKLGHFTDFSAVPSCGLATNKQLIGAIDNPKSFLNQQRVDASLIWLSQGFLEYKIPKPLKNDRKIEMLDISMELSSEFPISNNTWPTTLKIILNNCEVAKVTIPGNFSDVRGLLTPSWWDDDFSQYGLLTHIRINRSDTSVDGIKVSDHNLLDTHIESSDFINLRIETDQVDGRYGGLTIFGKEWGNHPQDINFDFYIS